MQQTLGLSLAVGLAVVLLASSIPAVAADDSSATLSPPGPSAADKPTGPSGRSCILGADGAVLYRPAGARCKGDPAPVADPSQPPASVGSESEAGAPPEPSRRGCMYGADGEVVYAPTGSKC